MTQDTERLRVSELVLHTPADRNRYVDFLRVASLGVVVIGHWMMAGVWIDEGGVSGRNVLELVPVLVFATWVFQVMPVFFIVGGYANAASWRAARRKGVDYAEWLRGRMERLLRPTLLFIAVWTAVAVLLARVAPIEPGLLASTTRLLAIPLWFLAVYVLVIPAAPPMLRLHERFGWKVVAVLTLAAIGGDALRRLGGIDAAGWGNYLFVWLAIHQLGFFWRDGKLQSMRTRLVMAGAGLAAMITLTALDLYSHSMLGVGDEGNNAPPTVMLIVLAFWQLGLVLAVEGPMRRWLERPRVWAVVITANGLAMTIYLWHQTAMIIVVVAALISGYGLRSPLLSSRWWSGRPFWVLSLMAALLPLLLLFRRAERIPRSPRPRRIGGNPVLAVAGALATAAGLVGLVLQGFLPGSGPGGIAAIPLLFLAVGAMLLLRGR